MKTMKDDIIDLLKVGFVNSIAFIGANSVNVELVLKYTLYLLSIVYTAFKIIKMIADRIEDKRSKKEIKKEV